MDEIQIAIADFRCHELGISGKVGYLGVAFLKVTRDGILVEFHFFLSEVAGQRNPHLHVLAQQLLRNLNRV